MSEMKKSLSFVGVALALALLALVTSPGRATPDALSDLGEPFFPDFTNPNEASTLEVVEFEDETAQAKPFKVTSQNGLWTIPSHHDYPADGEDRLAKTAAGVIGITKDDFRTDNVSDHEACGVVDPLDEGATTLKGRGKRVTLRGANDQVLADFIIGKKLDDRENFRFVRLPDQKRVYAARMDIDISTEFQDWIKKDLLQVERGGIEQIVLKDYSIDEITRRVNQRDVVTLRKRDGTWSLEKLPSGKELDQTKVNTLLSTLDELSIVGVRPKPQGLSEGLKRVEKEDLAISQADLLSLQDKGYFFSGDGSLLSNEGELQARTTDGLIYTLRFGEVVYGRGETVTAGTGSGNEEAGPGENRYLFITTQFDPSVFPEPRVPASMDFEGKAEADLTDADRKNKELHDKYEEWRSRVEKGRTLSSDLNRRFATWYYVISSDSFEKVDLDRTALTKSKES